MRNIYITGHGALTSLELGMFLPVYFYIDEYDALDMVKIPYIVGGNYAIVNQYTRNEHIIFGTQIDSMIDEYRIDGFDMKMCNIQLGNRQILKQYQNSRGDINIFPCTDNEQENIINDHKLLQRRGNQLSSIITYFTQQYPSEKFIFHWLACRSYYG